jgi:hypothetical protein
VVEKDKTEDYPSLLIDGDVPAIANTPHEVHQSRFELFFAAPEFRQSEAGS